MNTKLRCLLVYRLEIHHDSHHVTGPTNKPILLATFHAQKELAKIGARVIHNAPPSIPANHCTGMLGGFIVRRSGDAQLVYCADADGICYCVVTGLGYHDRVAMLCLAELAREFQQALGDLAIDAEENSLSCASKGVFGTIYSKYEDVNKVKMIFRRRVSAKQTEVAMNQTEQGPKKDDTSEQGAEDTEFKQIVSAFKKKKRHSMEKEKRVRFAPFAAKDIEKQGTKALQNKRQLESENRSTKEESVVRATDDVAGEKFISSLLLGGSLMNMATGTTRSGGEDDTTDVEGHRPTLSCEMTELPHEEIPAYPCQDDQREGQNTGDDASLPASLGGSTFNETQDEGIGQSTSNDAINEITTKIRDDMPCSNHSVNSRGQGCKDRAINLRVSADFEEIGTRSSDSSFVEFLPFESMPCLFPYDMPSGLSFCGYSVTSSGAATMKAESMDDASQQKSYRTIRSSCDKEDSSDDSLTLEDDQTSTLVHQNSILRKMTLKLAAENRMLREACKGWEMKYEKLSQQVDETNTRPSLESSNAEDPATSGAAGASGHALRFDSLTPKPAKDEGGAQGVESNATRQVQNPPLSFPYSMEEIIEQLGELDKDDSFGRHDDDPTAFQPRRKRHDKKPTPPQMKQPAAVPNYITI